MGRWAGGSGERRGDVFRGSVWSAVLGGVGMRFIGLGFCGLRWFDASRTYWFVRRYGVPVMFFFVLTLWSSYRARGR